MGRVVHRAMNGIPKIISSIAKPCVLVPYPSDWYIHIYIYTHMKSLVWDSNSTSYLTTSMNVNPNLLCAEAFSLGQGN